MDVAGFVATDIAGVVPIGPTRTEGLCFGLPTKPPARISAPDSGGAGAVNVAAPPVFCGSRRVARKIAGIKSSRVPVVVIEDGEELFEMLQCPKELWVFENETHTFGGRLPDFYLFVADWLRDALDGKLAAGHAKRIDYAAR